MKYKNFLTNVRRQFSYVGEPEVLIRIGANLQKFKIWVANIKDMEIHQDHIEFWIVNRSKPDEDILGAESERMRRKEIVEKLLPKQAQKQQRD